MTSKKNRVVSTLWNTWCIASIVGIWPRYVEPTLVTTKRIPLELGKARLGIRVLQISDLHYSRSLKTSLLERILNKVKFLNPDLIVFTGDLINRSYLEDKHRLTCFLKKLKAPLGCFAILGNHDYSEPVTIDQSGIYTLLRKETHPLLKGFQRILSAPTPKGIRSAGAEAVRPHKELTELFQECGFRLLQNESAVISSKGRALNLVGLGDYMTGHFQPDKAFSSYDEELPGIVLAHNPDAAPHLLSYPGDLILSGHTHGGQVNLPYLWSRFIRLENPQYKNGLFHVGDKILYVNKGVGGGIHFRWFAPPELTLLELQ